MADLALYLEAEKRGILPPDKAALLAEARSRGLIGKPEGKANIESVSAIPQPAQAEQEQPGLSTAQEFGHAAASLADTTIGGVVPMAAQLAYPFIRPFTTPQRATEITGKIVGAVDKPFGKAFGVTESPAYKGEASNQLMHGVGSAIQDTAGQVSDVTGLPVEDVQNMLGTAAMSIPGAAKAGVAAAKKLPIVATKLAERDAAAIAENQANVLRVDAANKAHQMGIVLNPADSNPTVANKVKGSLAGHDEISSRAAALNKTKWSELASDEMGLPKGTPLTGDAFDSARALVAGPYDAVKNGPPLQPIASVIADIRALAPNKVIGGSAALKKAQVLIDDAVGEVNGVMSGDAVIKSISDLRKDANNIYTSANKPNSKQRAIADTSLGIANALEDLIDANYASNPKFVAELRDARKAMAKTYAYEAATDLNTGLVDPQKLAKLTAKNDKLTGTIADIGNIAGNFPDIAKVKNIGDQLTHPRLVRGGAMGTLGFGVGAAAGMPFAGSVIGATLGEAGSKLGRARILSKAYQEKHGTPYDPRKPKTPQENNALRRELVRAGMIASQNYLGEE